MKKITLSVAALTIAVMSYSQCTSSYRDSLQTTQWNAREITNTAEDMIEWIGQDVENGKIYKEYAEMYIENLEDILTKLKE